MISVFVNLKSGRKLRGGFSLLSKFECMKNRLSTFALCPVVRMNFYTPVFYFHGFQNSIVNINGNEYQHFFFDTQNKTLFNKKIDVRMQRIEPFASQHHHHRRCTFYMDFSFVFRYQKDAQQ